MKKSDSNNSPIPSLFDELTEKSGTDSSTKKHSSAGLAIVYKAGQNYEVEISRITVNPSLKLRQIPQLRMEALVGSIKTFGILNPLLCIIKDEQLLLVAGQQRLAAAKMIGIHSVPVRTIKGDPELIAAHENLLRQNLTLIEEAELLQAIKGKKKRRIEELTAMFGISSDNVAKLLSIASLSEKIRDELRLDTNLSMDFVLSLTRVTSEKEQLAILSEYKTLNESSAGKKRKPRSKKGVRP